MKECNKCKEVKSLDKFNKNKTGKNGLRSNCKECEKQHRLTNKEKRAEQRKQYRRTNKEIIAEKYKHWYENNKEQVKQYIQSNKEKRAESYKQWRESNKEKIKQYRESNKEKIAKKYYQYQKNRLTTDPIFKFKYNVRNLIRHSFKKHNHRKATRTEQILGCSLDFFKVYISNQFQKGMSFDNSGKWHLDHIIPLATANTEEDVIRLNHYTNFQPLWAEENLKKSNKIIEQQLVLI